MKRIIFLLLTALSLLSSYANTRLYGKILHGKDSTVSVKTWDGIEYIESKGKVNKKGNFSILVKCFKPAPYTLTYGNEQTTLFISPGDSQYVLIDYSLFDESIKYSGDGSAANNYLAKRILSFENTIESEDFRKNHAKRIAYDETDVFVKYIDSLTKIRLDFLSEYPEKLPTTFYDFEWADIVFSYTREKSDFPIFHFYIQGIRDSVLKVDSSYYNFYEILPINNENHLISYNFKLYLQEYVRHKAKQRFLRDSLSYLDISTVGAQILKGKIFETFISDFAVNTFEYASVTETKSMFEFAGTLIKDTLLRKQMTKRYEEKARLFPGKMAPVFSLADISGKKISLTKFKGKIIYIDFWASWCGPCRMEMPASKILQKQFVGKDVVFLYISLDDDKASWIKALKAEELNGVHLHAPGWENSVAKKYGINGIPAYFLIGRNGEILENNASRPSDKSTVELINKALLK